MTMGVPEILIVFFLVAGLVFLFSRLSPTGKKWFFVGVSGLVVCLMLIASVVFVYSSQSDMPGMEISVGVDFPVSQELASMEVARSQSDETAPPLNFSADHLAAWSGVLVLLVLISCFIWLLVRYRGMRAITISLLASLVVLSVFLLFGKGMLWVQRASIETTSTLVTPGQGEIRVSEPGEIASYMRDRGKALFVIIMAMTVVFSFAMYVFLVSRKPSGVSSRQVLGAFFWSLPVVLVSGIVLLGYAVHLDYSTQATVVDVARMEGSPSGINLPGGGFEEDRLVRIEDDLPLDELEKQELEIPVGGPVRAEKPEDITALQLHYPDWIKRGEKEIVSTLDRGKVFRFTVMSDLYESNQEAVKDALSRASARTVSLFGQELQGTVLTEIPYEFLRESAVVHTYGVAGLISTDQHDFPMHRVWLDCEVSTLPESQPFRYWRELLVQHRMWSLASLSGFVVLVFVTVAGYFRLNQFSQGRYRRRLKLAAVSMLVVAGLGVTFLI